MKRRLVAGSWIFLVSAALTSLFFINFCATVYQCGCRSLWDGAALHCNIHMPQARHCPWCAVGASGAAAIYGAILAGQAVCSFFPPWIWPWRLAAAVAAFPGVGFLIAVLMGIAQGYWEF